MNYKSNEKMDIGDLGFLIIAFIVFIVNFIVKSNKEKAEAQAQKQQTAKPELPEPWEEEYEMPPFFDIPAIPTKGAEDDLKTSKSFIPISDSIKSKDKRMQSALEGVSSLSESLFKEDEMESVSYQDEETMGEISYTNELFHGNITEELKKGIIYSEILNRKYE